MRDGALAHQYLGSDCRYNTLPGTAAPDHRSCAAGGEAIFTGGRWVSSGTAAEPQNTGPGSSPVRFTLRDWQINSLAPRGQAGECESHKSATGGVRFSTAAGPTLITNLLPNPGAQVTATSVVERDGSGVTVRLCNTGGTAVRWETPPDITVTQLP